MLHILGGVLPVMDTVEVMLVVLHAYKIYDKEALVTYELWYKLIQYVLTMTSPNLEESQLLCHNNCLHKQLAS